MEINLFLLCTLLLDINVYSFNENVKQHNNGKTFSPGSITFDGWPPFLNQACLLWNNCTANHYSDSKLKQVRGDNIVVDFKTLLITCFKHLNTDIEKHFDYPTSQYDRNVSKEIRRRIKELGKMSAKVCRESLTYVTITNAMQFVNILSR